MLKNCLITGSSHGLGKELAIEFSKKYYVILIGRDLEALKKVCKRIPEQRRCVIQGDLTKPETIENLAKIAINKNIDILINNAGIYQDVALPTEKDLREVMEVNFFVPVNLTLKLLPFFVKKQKGLIININSIAGKEGSINETAYAASKHALRGFFDSLRYTTTKRGIRILDVYLGAMNTKMTEGRKNVELLIDPKEAAKVIVKNCELYESLSINEINMRRIKYM